MMRRRIEERYGFGAARLALRVEPIHVGEPDHALARAFGMFGRDLRAEGFARALRYGSAPILGLVLVALLSLATLLSRPELDDSDIELVPFEVAAIEPEPEIIEETIPEPEPLAPEPPQLAEPAPPPAPIVKPQPEPARVQPKPTPPPVARPRVQIDAIASATPPKPALERPPVERVRPEPARPRIDIAPLAAAPAPDLAPAPEPQRERFRVASAAPERARPTVRVEAMSAPSVTSDSPPAPRSAPRRAAPQERTSAPRPDLAPAAQDLALPSEREAPRSRTARVAPLPDAVTSGSARPNVEVAGLGATATAPAARPRTPERTARVAPVAAPADGPRRSEAEERLASVPLGSLAACVSDAREDALKQQVIAAVTTQKECVSEAGHYRFLQTKNLNSFLMYVERARSRAEADRCVELRHALDCLERGQRTRTRTS